MSKAVKPNRFEVKNVHCSTNIDPVDDHRNADFIVCTPGTWAANTRYERHSNGWRGDLCCFHLSDADSHGAACYCNADGHTDCHRYAAFIVITDSLDGLSHAIYFSCPAGDTCCCYTYRPYPYTQSEHIGVWMQQPGFH